LIKTAVCQKLANRKKIYERGSTFRLLASFPQNRICACLSMLDASAAHAIVNTLAQIAVYSLFLLLP